MIIENEDPGLILSWSLFSLNFVLKLNLHYMIKNFVKKLHFADICKISWDSPLAMQSLSTTLTTYPGVAIVENTVFLFICVH